MSKLLRASGTLLPGELGDSGGEKGGGEKGGGTGDAVGGGDEGAESTCLAGVVRGAVALAADAVCEL